MRNCAGRRLSFFFSSAYSALHQSNISLFLLFLFFHSFPLALSLSPVTSIPSRRELSFSNAFRASFAHLPGRERGRTSRIVNARGRSVTRSARTVSLCAGKKPWHDMRAKLSAPRRRGLGNGDHRPITRDPLLKMKGKRIIFIRGIIYGPVSILSIFVSLELSTRLSPRLKNIWNIKFGILFLLAIPRNSIEKKFDSFSRSDYSRSRIGQLPFPERGKKPR